MITCFPLNCRNIRSIDVVRSHIMVLTKHGDNGPCKLSTIRFIDTACVYPDAFLWVIITFYHPQHALRCRFLEALLLFNTKGPQYYKQAPKFPSHRCFRNSNQFMGRDVSLAFMKTTRSAFQPTKPFLPSQQHQTSPNPPLPLYPRRLASRSPLLPPRPPLPFWNLPKCDCQ